MQPLGPEWWNSVIADAFAVVEPILEELVRTMVGDGYPIGEQPPTWERLIELSQAKGDAYAGELLRRMLVNPSTRADAEKLIQEALAAAARRQLERSPGAVGYALGGA